MTMKKILAVVAIGSSLAGAMPSAAFAHERGGRGWHHESNGDDDDEDYRGYRGQYQQPQRYYAAPQAYAQPYRCRTSGTTGLIVGGAAGALLGREITRDRTLGALLGGGLGAIAGRELTRKNRC